jgi:hypothetical protein
MVEWLGFLLKLSRNYQNKWKNLREEISMPLPSSGKITTQTFRDFFEITASTPINSSDWYRGGPYVRANYQSQNQGTKSINNQVPTSGRIALSDLYGVYKVVDANNYVPGNTNPNNTTDNVPGNENPQDSTQHYNPANDPDLNPGNNNPPNNDYGAGPAGIYEDPFDYTNPGSNNPPNPGNPSNPSNAGDGADSGGGPPNFGSGDNEAADGSDPNPGNPGNPGNYVPGNPATNNPDGGTAGNTNPGNPVDGSAGPPGSGDPNPGNPTNTSGGDAGAGPGGAYEDPTTNPVTSNDPNTNPPYWADHERLV